MAIKIVPAIPEDGLEIMELGYKAFDNDLNNKSLFPDPMSEEQRAEYIEWRRKTWTKQLGEENKHSLKAVDDTNTIVGHASWHGPVPYDAGKAEGPRWQGMPDFVNSAVLDEMGEAFSQAKKEAGFADRSDFWYLRGLAVHPDHQGKGIASMLMDYSLQEFVDRDGTEAYLESSPAGWKTYLRCGFEEKMQLSRLEGTYVMRIMVRPARAKTNAAVVNGVS